MYNYIQAPQSCAKCKMILGSSTSASVKTNRYEYYIYYFSNRFLFFLLLPLCQTLRFYCLSRSFSLFCFAFLLPFVRDRSYCVLVVQTSRKTIRLDSRNYDLCVLSSRAGEILQNLLLSSLEW